MMTKEELQSKLESAITEYQETNDIEVLKQFFGKCSGIEPFGEPELGSAINSGDIQVIQEIITRLTTIVNCSEDQSIPNKDLYEDAIKTSKDNQDTKQRQKQSKELSDKRIENAKKWTKKSKDAKKNLEDLKEQQEYDKINGSKTQEADQSYWKSDEEVIKNEMNKHVNASYNKHEDKIMKLSKTDIKKLTRAMNTIQKHFAEEEYENGEIANAVAEVNAEDTDVIDENVDPKKYAPDTDVNIAVSQDVIDALETIVNDASLDRSLAEETATSTNVPEDDGTENTYVPATDEEEEAVVNECGTGFGSNFSENAFYEFAEATTEAIQNLKNYAEEVASKAFTEGPITDETKDLQDAMLGENDKQSIDKYIDNFSAKDFKYFAESITTTLENINKRIEQLENVVVNDVTPNKITTDLTAIEETGDDYEEEFITKADEDVNVDGIVENPEASVEEQAGMAEQVKTGQQFSKRYNKVKNFLTFTDKL